jgi:hypothetical protein
MGWLRCARFHTTARFGPLPPQSAADAAKTAALAGLYGCASLWALLVPSSRMPATDARIRPQRSCARSRPRQPACAPRCAAPSAPRPTRTAEPPVDPESGDPVPMDAPNEYEGDDALGGAALLEALGAGLGRGEMTDVTLAAKRLGQDPRRGVATVRRVGSGRGRSRGLQGGFNTRHGRPGPLGSPHFGLSATCCAAKCTATPPKHPPGSLVSSWAPTATITCLRRRCRTRRRSPRSSWVRGLGRRQAAGGTRGYEPLRVCSAGPSAAGSLSMRLPADRNTRAPLAPPPPPPAPPQGEGEAPLEWNSGANAYVYFATSSAGGPLAQLPHVTPGQVKAARRIKKLLTGRLTSEVREKGRLVWQQAPGIPTHHRPHQPARSRHSPPPLPKVSAYPVFPGTEANYLRAQVRSAGQGWLRGRLERTHLCARIALPLPQPKRPSAAARSRASRRPRCWRRAACLRPTRTAAWTRPRSGRR